MQKNGFYLYAKTNIAYFNTQFANARFRRELFFQYLYWLTLKLIDCERETPPYDACSIHIMLGM